jgi:predicted RNase H-like HicB family nuclease
MFKRDAVVYEREGGAGFGLAAKRSAPRGHRTLSREYTACIYRNEGGARGYWADFPSVPGIVSGGDTIAQTLRRAREALRVHLEWLIEDDEPLPDDHAPKRGASPKPAVMQKIKVSLARR